MEIKKGHTSFIEFLNRELSALNLIHWRDSFEGYQFHSIGEIVLTKHRFLFFKWNTKRTIIVANIISEPSSDPDRSLGLQIKVKDSLFLSVFQKIAEKFENEFQLKAEIVY